MELKKKIELLKTSSKELKFLRVIGMAQYLMNERPFRTIRIFPKTD